MNINVRVITNARQSKITVCDDGVFKVHVTVVPENGRANNAVIKMLADHLGVAKSRIKLIRGATSRDKVFVVV